MDEPIRPRPAKPRMRPVRVPVVRYVGGKPVHTWRPAWHCYMPGAEAGTGDTPLQAWQAMHEAAAMPWAGLMHADPAEVLGERFAAARALERGLRL